jgi:hypothetical protein
MPCESATQLVRGLKIMGRHVGESGRRGSLDEASPEAVVALLTVRRVALPARKDERAWRLAALRRTRVAQAVRPTAEEPHLPGRVLPRAN